MLDIDSVETISNRSNSTLSTSQSDSQPEDPIQMKKLTQVPEEFSPIRMAPETHCIALDSISEFDQHGGGDHDSGLEVGHCKYCEFNRQSYMQKIEILRQQLNFVKVSAEISQSKLKRENIELKARIQELKNLALQNTRDWLFQIRKIKRNTFTVRKAASAIPNFHDIEKELTPTSNFLHDFNLIKKKNKDEITKKSKNVHKKAKNIALPINFGNQNDKLQFLQDIFSECDINNIGRITPISFAIELARIKLDQQYPKFYNRLICLNKKFSNINFSIIRSEFLQSQN